MKIKITLLLILGVLLLITCSEKDLKSPTNGIGPNGGTVSNANGFSVTILPGALNETINLKLESPSEKDIPIALPIGCEFIGAISLKWDSGTKLAIPATFKFPTITTNVKTAIVARLEERQNSPRLKIVDVGTINNGWFISSDSHQITYSMNRGAISLEGFNSADPRASSNAAVGLPIANLSGVSQIGTYVVYGLVNRLGLLIIDVFSQTGQPIENADIEIISSSTDTNKGSADVQDAQDKFVGRTNSEGVAVISAVQEDTEVIVVASYPNQKGGIDTGTASISIPSPLTDIVEGVKGVVKECTITITSIDPDDVPDQPECPCGGLTVYPHQITSSTSYHFKPGSTTQLKVYCGSDDVTQGYEIYDIFRRLSENNKVFTTSYYSTRPEIARVNRKGEIVAVALGSCEIAVIYNFFKFVKIGNEIYPFLLRCPAVGSVAPVIVSDGSDTEYVISHSSNQNDGIYVDDILRVFINGKLVAEVSQGGRCCPPVPPIHFIANTGDILRIQAQDANNCYSLESLWLQKFDGSCLTKITGNISGPNCGFEPPEQIFFDQTFILP